jgi:hypothetical protein
MEGNARGQREHPVTGRGQVLLEDSEVPQQPPENDEDQDGAEAPAPKLLGTVSGGDAA